MTDIVLIKPRELPEQANVQSTDALIVDNGAVVGKATPAKIVDAGAPIASEAEAVAGIDNTKRMTPLRVQQALLSASSSSVMLAKAWAESPTAPDPLLPDSKSSKTWALEAEQSAEDAESAASTAATDTAALITADMQGYVLSASGSASAAAISAGQAAAVMAGSVRFDQSQTLTAGQRQQAAENIAAVSYDAQTLTSGQKQQARGNISAPLTPAGSQGGDIRYGQVNAGAAVVIPPGGTWEYDICLLSEAGSTWVAPRTGGIAAGGTAVGGTANIKMYRLWRIA